MLASGLKHARMEFKTTDDVKELLSKAAALSGVDLTSFVINTAADRARAVLADHSVLKLTAEEHARFLSLLDNPPQPTKGLVDLMNMTELPSQ
ncbi:MAG: type II toxin-antitoxin system TacA family antitoxin [Leptospirillum sp.]|jgi:uncharacterized protein (DUF1778 family)